MSHFGGGDAAACAAALLNSDAWNAQKVQMLDHLVALMLSGDEAQRRIAHEVLNKLKSYPDSWQAVDTILATSQSPDTKFFALNLLENVIETRWLVLPEQQRNGVKNYVVQLVIRISADEQSVASHKHFLTKLNETLVHIVKQEWPHQWANFIPDICSSSRTNQSLCQNNLRILNMLSEEVFNFGRNRMVSRKVAQLKDSLNAQFSTIYELCDFIFKTHLSQPGAVQASLLNTALETLSNFLSWIPLGYIFETDLIKTLLVSFWDPLDQRIACVKCLNEIACLRDGVQQYAPQITQCFQGVVDKINQLPDRLPQDCTALPAPQRVFWEVFHNQLALLLTGFLKNDMLRMEAQMTHTMPALKYLVRITAGPNEETFKICVEFWHTFSARLFLELKQGGPAQQVSPLLLDGAGRAPNPAESKVRTYDPILTEVRNALISKMVKPPEVTIKENEEGQIVRAEEEDTDELALYKMMREALIYLTHLNAKSMEHIMQNRLAQECLANPGNGMEHWSPTQLNRLCWAIGSISGAMSEADEKRFLVSVIKDLLSLCELKRQKDSKAVVASNIMYVVGQYPRFLKAHWKFLKTVIFKLFEFMQETFPGVQEMAVDTFLKICQKCRKKFVIPQHADQQQMPFVEEMVSHIAQDVSKLEHLHICTYFEALGYMISAADTKEKERLINQMMQIFNAKWASIVQSLNNLGETLLQQDLQVLRDISLILRVNQRMITALGAACYSQLAAIYTDALNIYKACSDFISQNTLRHGMQIMGHQNIRLMRNVKRDTLRLVQTFFDVSAAPPNVRSPFCTPLEEVGRTVQQIAQAFVPPLLTPVLEDYRANLPQARDAEVLDLLATLATRLSDIISLEVPSIFEKVFECTLDMIKGDFQSYMDHRTKFYELLKAVNANCFQGLLVLPEARLKLYVDSLIWAVKHEQPQVSDMGLQILSEFIDKLLGCAPQVYIGFFTQYYFTLLQDILSVLTDTMHKAGFKLQIQIMMQLISVTERNLLQEAVTKQRCMEFMHDLLTKSFTTLHRSQVETFVLNCFNFSSNPAAFNQLLRDFLIQLRQWGSQEDALYEAERQEALAKAQAQEASWRMQVPGLVPQYDPIRIQAQQGDMDDI
mmetsp:Transcript_52155/g.124265  ORF Transcript_52155/g.124265 Transcript_52155/m.124265 type:complete len:1113 (-) Transcript_52155:113-3451(-)|eukprot:CAMPEP_0178441592 /NCGR_PEP_ID=MMETSP0689_2-20121128/37563_1 /TAXON_ID=160604 /ORGANISM="Amphidinium massartii, Strain CS-259" /LENGTH=1112 /DNA_ID=CAMNT_0020064781 /DNA_START=140 /DNA_END=3478 /DNA_ORIENTATION=-